MKSESWINLKAGSQASWGTEICQPRKVIKDIVKIVQVTVAQFS